MTSTFETYRERLDSHRRALRSGLTDAEVVDAIRVLDAAVLAVDGVGFAPTPSAPQPALAAALGLDAELWVKDETGNVSGSHKARHLMGVMLWLEAQRRLGTLDKASFEQLTLAISSCGNAALAAAVVAKAASRHNWISAARRTNAVRGALRRNRIGRRLLSTPISVVHPRAAKG